jgi:outer membrane receptor protein involved in Fe transport
MKKFLPIFLVLLVAATAYAQNKGRVMGTVTTADGAVITGVKVTITSDALIAGTMETTTSDRGVYRFVLLPVGTYDIRFEKESYKPVEQKGLELAFEATLILDKVMEVGTFEELITVTGEAPLVDKTKSGIGDKLDTQFLQNIPNTRNVWAMPNLSAGYTDNAAFGAVSDGGNTYSTDGVNVSDPSTKTVFSSINLEAVEQVDVAMFGSPAEYGSFTGAALNVVTKSGGNEFHGEVNYFMQSVSWVSDNTTNFTQHGITAPTATKLTDPNFAVGGPILRDKIWFFFNYNYQKFETQRELIDKTVTQLEDPKRPFIKVSAMWNDRNISYVSYIRYDRYRSHRVAYGDWRTNYEDSLWEQPSVSDTYLFQHSYVLSDSLIFEGRFAGFRGGFDLVPRSPGPMVRDYYSGEHLLVNGEAHLSRSDLYTRNRDNLLLSTNYFNDDFRGSHSMKFGLEYESHMGNRLYTHEENIYYRYGEPYRWYNYGTYEGGRLTKRLAGFAQDSWSLSDRLTVNIGFRYDYSWAVAENANLGGLAGSDTFRKFKDPAWRLGFAYDLFGDGKTVVRGFYGRYYEGVVSGNIEPYVTYVPPTIQYRWNGSAWYVYSVTGGSDPDAFYIDPETRNQYTEGVMLGVEREIRPNLSGSVNFVYKYDNDILGEYDPYVTYDTENVSFSGNGYTYSGVHYPNYNPGSKTILSNPKKGDPGVLDDPYRKYWGLVLEVKKRMSDNWSLRASYSYSVAVSNNLSQDYGVIQGFDSFGDPNSWINSRGRSTYDRPHTFKVGGTYIAPFDIFISPAVTWYSGTPYSIFFSPDEDVRMKPRDGSERYDNEFNIDLRVEKVFNLYKKYRAGVIFDVFNVMNDDAVIGYRSTNVQSSTFLVPSTIVRSRYYQLGFRFIF